jgi:mRNA-degrading endonuclease RelE of RelBE toxin-antitoxin system
MTDTPHIITSANGRTYDLTALETPPALLPADVHKALEDWRHGLQRLHSSQFRLEPQWRDVDHIVADAAVYRAKPAPKTTEHVLWWRAGTDATTFIGDIDTHRLTIRHTGDTLPYGTYTGPDGATFTVEKAQ